MTNPIYFKNPSSIQSTSQSISETAGISTPKATVNHFESLIELLPPEKQKEVLDEIESLECKETIIESIVELAQSRDYKRFSAIFLDQKFEFYALAAVKEHRLSPIQFGTLMFVRAVLEEGITIDDFQTVPLFDKEAPSSDAWNQIKATLKADVRGAKSVMNKHELAQFFEIMRSQPNSEQHFVLIPDKRNPKIVSDISQAVNQVVYFNLFCGVEVDGKKMRMIPSFGMVQALLDATGDDHFTFKLRIGESTPESLRQSILKDNAREMCVHCREIAPAPAEADGYDATPLNFMYHDLYHIWASRVIPQTHRNFFCDVADVANPDHFSSKPAKSAAYDIYVSFLDLDIEPYRTDINGRSIDLQYTSSRSVKRVLNVQVPMRKAYFNVETVFTLDEVDESKSVSEALNAKIKTLFAIWKLYKPNYKNFREIIDFYDQLSPKLQQNLGSDLLELEDQIGCYFPPLFKAEDVAQFKPEEIGELLNLFKIGGSQLRYLVSNSLPFKKIWELPLQKREVIVIHGIKVVTLIEAGISFSEIAELDLELLRLILSSDSDYIYIEKWKKQGIEFRKSAQLLSKILKTEGNTESIGFKLFNLAKSESTINAFLQAEPKTIRLIIDETYYVEIVTEGGLAIETLIKVPYSKLESLLKMVSDRRFDLKTCRFLNITEIMNRDPEVRSIIQKLKG